MKGTNEMTDAQLVEALKARAVVTERGCWEWQGTCVPFRNMKPGQRGYPSAYVRGKSARVHRLMIELTQRPLLKGELAMHTCDNPPCVNPDKTPMPRITIKPIYDAKRTSLRRQLFGVYAGDVLVLISTTYPAWATKEIA
jgi:hypothetical protein